MIQNLLEIAITIDKNIADVENILYAHSLTHRDIRQLIRAAMRVDGEEVWPRHIDSTQHKSSTYLTFIATCISKFACVCARERKRERERERERDPSDIK